MVALYSGVSMWWWSHVVMEIPYGGVVWYASVKVCLCDGVSVVVVAALCCSAIWRQPVDALVAMCSVAPLRAPPGISAGIGRRRPARVHLIVRRQERPLRTPRHSGTRAPRNPAQ